MRSVAASRLVGILTTTVLVAGCAGTPTVSPQADVATSAVSGDLRGSIALLALSMIGVPYRYGGSDPQTGFDCSGLVYYTYTWHGHAVPRTSREQFSAARKVPLDQAAEGDLLFFQDQADLSHVGIYVGEGRFVHAPSSGDTVRIARIDEPFYQRHLIAIGRFLPDARSHFDNQSP